MIIRSVDVRLCSKQVSTSVMDIPITPVFLMVTLVFLSSVISLKFEGHDRGKRSDDTNPLAVMVDGLEQRADQMAAQLTSLQDRVGR